MPCSTWSMTRRLPDLLTALVAALTLAYPVAVYAGTRFLEPKGLALVLLSVALARALVARQAFWWTAAAGAAFLAGLSLWANALLPLKFYPVLVNAVFLFVFAASLAHPPTVVERLARITEPDLPPEAVAYTRRVTQIWCAFFVLNGSVAAAVAGWGSTAAWALYTGFISYLLMGLLFGGEWLMRRRLRARIAAAQLHAHG